MQVLGKFILGGITPMQVSYHGEVVTGANVSLRAAQGEPFGEATPSGSIGMSIHNPSAAKVFLDAPAESAFYVTFERADEAAPAAAGQAEMTSEPAADAAAAEVASEPTEPVG